MVELLVGLFLIGVGVAIGYITWGRDKKSGSGGSYTGGSRNSKDSDLGVN